MAAVAPLTPQHVDRVPEPKVTCFSSFAEAASHASPNPVLGVHYDDADRRGGSMTIYATSGIGCYGATYGVAFVGNYWNDNLESGYSYSNCDHRVFEHYDYAGARSATVGGFGTYELLNNEVSSILYVPR